MKYYAKFVVVLFLFGKLDLAAVQNGVEINPLESSEIRALMVQKSTSKPSATVRLCEKLFPSPFQEVEIFGVKDKDLAYYLDTLNKDTALDITKSLFAYCLFLRENEWALENIACLRDYFEQTSEKIKKLKNTIKNLKRIRGKREPAIDRLLDCINDLEHTEAFASSVKEYREYKIDPVLAMLGKTMVEEQSSYTVERLLWTFACEFWEDEQLDKLQQAITSTALHRGLRFERGISEFFPYKVGTPFVQHGVAVVEDVEFPDCIETAVRHFLNLVQPKTQEKLKAYWNVSTSHAEDVSNFFLKTQGFKRANSDKPYVRTAWAKFLQNIPTLVYKKKSRLSEETNVELKAGWFNFLKAIAYLRGQQSTLNGLVENENRFCYFRHSWPRMCHSFKHCCIHFFRKLADESFKDIRWIYDDNFGIRDMGDGRYDLLGRIRCYHPDIPNGIDFVMQDGHGFVEWELQKTD